MIPFIAIKETIILHQLRASLSQFKFLQWPPNKLRNVLLQNELLHGHQKSDV